jgi:hypothetical protein
LVIGLDFATFNLALRMNAYRLASEAFRAGIGEFDSECQSAHLLPAPVFPIAQVKHGGNGRSSLSQA